MTAALCLSPIAPQRRTHVRQFPLMERRRLLKMREEAMERLIATLEAAAAPDRPELFHALPALDCSPNYKRNQAARLRAAHAAYSLDSGRMLRVGPNSWRRAGAGC